MIRVEVKAKTDGGDYKVHYVIPNSCNQYTISYDLDYSLVLDFYNPNPNNCIAEFIRSIRLTTHKGDSFDYFDKAIEKYADQLDVKGPHTHNDDLLSGNWSFDIQMYKIDKTWL